MKLIFMLTLLTSSLVMAKATSATNKKVTADFKTSQTTTSSKKFDVRVPIKNFIKKNNNNFVVGFAQGTLGTNVRARKSGVDVSENEGRNTKMQLHFGWEQIKNREVGYNAFFTYQDIADGYTDLNGNNEDIRSMRWSANATYGINEQVYTYGGLNLNKFYGSEQVESSIDRGIGYQVGIGFDLHKRANLELEYLTLQNEGRIQGANIDIVAQGILLKINTPFQFNI